ncbi:MAG TPA: polysaccharide biosynthesis/export family protein [Candidatus Eisenbacteria bacterium]
MARAVLGVALSALFLLATAGPARAQATGGSEYRIGPGDVLRVEVTGHAELSQTVTVDAQGGVSLTSVGAIRASGRTPDDLASDISRRIALTQRETPQVRVTVLEIHRQRVFVLGSVLLPGAYTFKQDPTVWEAISEAGGASDDADLSAVEVIPGGGGDRAGTTYDVAAAIRSGDYSSMPRLKPGDTIRVPRFGGASGEGQLVFVLGAVSEQGPHALTPPGDLISVVTGSSPSPDADLAKIQIVRRTGGRIIQMKVNANDYLSDAQGQGNPQLHPGDTIYVPRQSHASVLSIFRVVSPLIGLVTSIVYLSSR